MYMLVYGAYMLQLLKFQKAKATVNLAVTVRNKSKTDTEIKLETRLLGPDGKIAATIAGTEKIESNKSKDINQTIKLENPSL